MQSIFIKHLTRAVVSLVRYCVYYCIFLMYNKKGMRVLRFSRSHKNYKVHVLVIDH